METRCLSGVKKFTRLLWVALVTGLVAGFSLHIVVFNHPSTAPISNGKSTPSSVMPGIPNTGRSDEVYSMPPGPKLADRELRFQWKALSGWEMSGEPDSGWLEVFLDGLSMGRYPMPAFPVSCQRSEDGSKMAFITPASGSEDNGSMLSSIDLSQPGKRTTITGLPSPDAVYAFDASWQELAFTTCGSDQANCEITLLNLSTRQISVLLHAGDVAAIRWSPDGDSIVFINRPGPGNKSMIGLLDLHTGELLFFSLTDVPELLIKTNALDFDDLASYDPSRSPGACTLALLQIK